MTASALIAADDLHQAFGSLAVLQGVSMALASNEVASLIGAYPPSNEKTADGKFIGFDIDIAKAKCMKMKREREIVAQDWDGITPSLVNTKFDAIAASVPMPSSR